MAVCRMIVVKEEQPFALAVTNKFLHNTCSFCLAHKVSVFKCNGCQMLSYCSRKCQQNDRVNHEGECSLLPKHTYTLTVDKRLALRILLKSEKGRGKKAFNGCTWDSLDAHYNDILNDSRYDRFMAEVRTIKRLLECILEEVEEMEIVKTLAKVKTNYHQIYDNVNYGDIIAHGIYLGLSAHPESCLPTSQLIFIGKKATLRPFEQNVGYSSDLTISRVSRNPFNMLRQRVFQKHYYYSCKCSLCIDYEHNMNKFGVSCYVDCCKDGVGLYSDGCYKCNKCGSPSKIDPKSIVYNKLHEYETVSIDRETAILDELKRYEKIASALNYTMVNFCYNTFIGALDQKCYKIVKYLEPKVTAALEHYFPEGHIRRAALSMARSYWTFEGHDNYDVKKGYEAAVFTFGENHPVVLQFKRDLGKFQRKAETKNGKSNGKGGKEKKKKKKEMKKNKKGKIIFF